MNLSISKVSVKTKKGWNFYSTRFPKVHLGKSKRREVQKRKCCSWYFCSSWHQLQAKVPRFGPNAFWSPPPSNHYHPTFKGVLGLVGGSYLICRTIANFCSLPSLSFGQALGKLQGKVVTHSEEVGWWRTWWWNV